jgi:hypothetical protein
LRGGDWMGGDWCLFHVSTKDRKGAQRSGVDSNGEDWPSFRRPHWTGRDWSGTERRGGERKGKDRLSCRRPHWSGAERSGEERNGWERKGFLSGIHIGKDRRVGEGNGWDWRGRDRRSFRCSHWTGAEWMGSDRIGWDRIGSVLFQASTSERK